MKEKKIKVLKVEPHKIPEVCILENNLESLQRAVVGLIEFLPLDYENKIDLMCNEEGKLIGLEGNRRVGNDIIVGIFYILKSDEMGNCCSLNNREIVYYKNRFSKPEYFTQEEIEKTLITKFYCN